MTDKVGVSSWHRLYGYRGDLYQELTLPDKPTIYHYRIPRRRLAGALRQGGEITENAWLFAQRNRPESTVGGTTHQRTGRADQRSTGGVYGKTGEMVKVSDALDGAGDGGVFA